MTVEVRVPEMGESISEVYVGEWSKSEGESVEQDEPLVELESDKATLELPAPAAGTLVKIIKQSGETAEVGEVIAEIGDRDGRPEDTKNHKQSASQQAAKQQTAATTDARDSSPDSTTENWPGPALLHEKRRKRHRTDDAPARRSRSAADAEPRHSPATPTDEVETRGPSAPPAPGDHPVETPSRSEERVPMSPVRRRIAERLVEAQHNAALLTTVNEIDMTAVKELRARCGEEFRRKYQVGLGYMSFFIKAAIDALEHCPALNAAIDRNEIVYHHYYDIGVAVSTEKGLVVPVVRDAQRMSFAHIERAIDDLAARAREGRLTVEELRGGTFTITNGGVFGSLLSTPIVNPPQSGVLGMHTIQDRPIAVGGQVAVRPMMYVALTYDHRLIDGREAVTFLKRIKTTIEDPCRLVVGV